MFHGKAGTLAGTFLTFLYSEIITEITEIYSETSLSTKPNSVINKTEFGYQPAYCIKIQLLQKMQLFNKTWGVFS